MKTIILSLTLLLIYSTNTFSQNYIFKMYRFECSQLFNISIDKPKGFDVIDGYIPFKINDKRKVGGIYRMVLQSKDKNCLILFPYFLIHRLHESATKSMVFAEIKTGLDLNTADKTIELDTVKYVKLFTGNNMENYFNADTVFVSEIPLREPYEGIYNYCTGVNIIKTGHPSAIIKVLFSDEGKKKEGDYMRALFNSIHYSNVAPTEYNTEKKAKTRKKFKYKFIFHRKKYEPAYF